MIVLIYSIILYFPFFWSKPAPALPRGGMISYQIDEVSPDSLDAESKKNFNALYCAQCSQLPSPSLG